MYHAYFTLASGGGGLLLESPKKWPFINGLNNTKNQTTTTHIDHPTHTPRHHIEHHPLSSHHIEHADCAVRAAGDQKLPVRVWVELTNHDNLREG